MSKKKPPKRVFVVFDSVGALRVTCLRRPAGGVDEYTVQDGSKRFVHVYELVEQRKDKP